MSEHTKGPWNWSDEEAIRRYSARQGAAAELLEVLKDAREELRLIRMKDTNALYDPTLRFRMDLVIAKAEGESEVPPELPLARRTK